MIRIIISRRYIKSSGIYVIYQLSKTKLCQKKKKPRIFITIRNIQICHLVHSPSSRREMKMRKKKKTILRQYITFDSGARAPSSKNFIFTPLVLRPRRVITLHLRRNRCHLAVDLLNNVIYGDGVFSLSLDISALFHARLDAIRIKPDRSPARRPFSSRISSALSPVLEQRRSRAHAVPRQGLRDFLLFRRASCRETGNNGGYSRRN